VIPLQRGPQKDINIDNPSLKNMDNNVVENLSLNRVGQGFKLEEASQSYQTAFIEKNSSEVNFLSGGVFSDIKDPVIPLQRGPQKDINIDNPSLKNMDNNVVENLSLNKVGQGFKLEEASQSYQIQRGPQKDINIDNPSLKNMDNNVVENLSLNKVGQGFKLEEASQSYQIQRGPQKDINIDNPSLKNMDNNVVENLSL
ncbi:MAG: hypothetical protein ACK4VK_08425, partial [Aquificaceae bacterium]